MSSSLRRPSSAQSLATSSAHSQATFLYVLNVSSRLTHFDVSSVPSLALTHLDRCIADTQNAQVATSDVVDLGDEDNSKHIYAMLSFIHGTTYRKIHQRNALGRNLDFHIDLYLIGEQFDVRSLRFAAANAFFHEAIFLSDTRYFPMAVQRILGPDAPVFADQFLVEVTIKICIEQIEKLVKNERFTEMAYAGELADEQMMIKLFFALGQRVRDMPVVDQWMSKDDRLLLAQKEMMAAEAAMGPGPWDRSIAGQVMAARAQNAAHAALTNAALLVPQPTWAPPPAILAPQPPAAALTSNPPPLSRPAVAHHKPNFAKMCVHFHFLSMEDADRG